MERRATAITTEHGMATVVGEPVLDTQEGTLTVIFEDLTARIFNWDKVVDYYYMSTEETQQWLAERRHR
ncbi:hypothetical protein SEA_HEXAMO_50 [Mycobacterium phage Hexamo]|uniref:Uncharacterized protein n=1 Tax=Mycobacterium phage Gruunaga TaxID=1897770 RepID=A0A1C9LYU3_9CAUD|nr:hypothetical protein X828_gp064 [Mycobacterium phage Artemis2UCLA]AHB29943.1 hypothetical protein ARTEMIS2UCLA_50 [Mycobacterium phage Artemis2UCLA]AOQ28064.1 hypothetical protein SEA_GRUUNAGA_50 [Mycobacterium phage Gruunaga]QAY14217.1 hypothetical protein SEA_HEXAMO_50 [Mycobacterium phage Hexamo]